MYLFDSIEHWVFMGLCFVSPPQCIQFSILFFVFSFRSVFHASDCWCFHTCKHGLVYVPNIKRWHGHGLYSQYSTAANNQTKNRRPRKKSHKLYTKINVNIGVKRAYNDKWILFSCIQYCSNRWMGQAQTKMPLILKNRRNCYDFCFPFKIPTNARCINVITLPFRFKWCI